MTMCKIVDGTSFIWSSLWFDGLETIYGSIILQQQPFTYPSQVKDLWIPGWTFFWKINLTNSLFNPTAANKILETHIII